MTVEELCAKESDVDFWEELSEHIDCFRICDACHKPMIEGYCIDDGAEHYCSRECLHTQMTDEEFEELSDEDGTSYFTNWYENSSVMGHTLRWESDGKSLEEVLKRSEIITLN